MEKEFKFQKGDIVQGNYSKSLFRVLHRNDVNKILLLTIKSNRKEHILGKQLTKHQPSNLYTLITREIDKTEIDYEIW